MEHYPRWRKQTISDKRLVPRTVCAYKTGQQRSHILNPNITILILVLHSVSITYYLHFFSRCYPCLVNARGSVKTCYFYFCVGFRDKHSWQSKVACCLCSMWRQGSDRWGGHAENNHQGWLQVLGQRFPVVVLIFSQIALPNSQQNASFEGCLIKGIVSLRERFGPHVL